MKVGKMSLDVLEQLESKIQTAVDTITLLQMEVEELKQSNQQLSEQAELAKEEKEALVQQNQQMQEEQAAWQQRIRTLLGKMEDVE